MYEINLVPDIKAEMIKAQKKRNFVFFTSAAISAMSVAIVLILGTIRAGMGIKIVTQDNTLELMSNKLNEYTGLDELLTIQNQLLGLSNIQSNKKVFSRVFSILAQMLPQGTDDTVTISSMNVDMDESMLSFEGQANAGPSTDGIDYRVLEAFTKSVGLMKYDYGTYVDKDGNAIPSMCISESDELGKAYTEKDESEGGTLLYAIWAKGVKGCDPSRNDDEDVVVNDEEVKEVISEAEGESETSQGNSNTNDANNNSDNAAGENVSEEGQTETKTEVETVKIYRTPRFKEWFKKNYMSRGGDITGVPHFESQCIVYSGIDTDNNTVKWESQNSCDLAPDGIEVIESSNGRQAGGDLVLRFTARTTLAPEVFDYNNKHMIAIAPTGKVNVTDSLLQIEMMFSERASDCEADDPTC